MSSKTSNLNGLVFFLLFNKNIVISNMYVLNFYFKLGTLINYLPQFDCSNISIADNGT